VPVSYVIVSAFPTTAVEPRAIFPLVFVDQIPVGIRVILLPTTDRVLGGVIVEIAVVPDTKVMMAVGAIVDAEAKVGAAVLTMFPLRAPVVV